MNRPTSHIADLAARAEQGDERARRELLQALAPALTRLARAAVATPPRRTQPEHPSPKAATSPLLRNIRAVAKRLTGGDAGDCDPLVLADNLGRLIAARIHPGPTEVATPTFLSA